MEGWRMEGWQLARVLTRASSRGSSLASPASSWLERRGLPVPHCLTGDQLETSITSSSEDLHHLETSSISCPSSAPRWSLWALQRLHSGFSCFISSFHLVVVYLDSNEDTTRTKKHLSLQWHVALLFLLPVCFHLMEFVWLLMILLFFNPKRRLCFLSF